MRHLHDKILSAAVSIARRKGFHKITQGEVAERSTAAEGTIHYHFGSMSGLRDAVVAYAIDHGELTIIGQAIAQKHRLAAKGCGISEEVRRKALLCLSA